MNSDQMRGEILVSLQVTAKALLIPLGRRPYKLGCGNFSPFVDR